MPGWRDRAVKVESKPSWRDRAVPVEASDARPDFEVTPRMGIDPKLRGVYERRQRVGQEQFGKEVGEGARTAFETVATGAAGALSGGLAIPARLAIAGASGAGASLTADAVSGEELDPTRAALTGASGVLGEGAGSAFAAALPAARRALGSAAEYAEPWLRKFAGEQAASSAGIRGRLQVRRAGGAQGIPDLGNRLIDEGVVTAGSSTAKAGERADALRKTAGETVGSLEDSAQAYGYGPRSQDIRGRLERIVTEYAPRNLESAEQLTRVVDRVKNDLASNVDESGRVPPEVIKKLEALVDDQLRSAYNSGPTGKLPAVAESIRKEMRRALKDAQEGAVETLGKGFEVDGLEAGPAYKKAKRQVGDAKAVSRSATYQEEGATGGARGLPGTLYQAAREAIVNPRVRSAAAVGARRIADRIAARGVDVTSGPGAEVVSMLEWAQGKPQRTVAAAASVLLSKYPELRDPIVEAVQELQAGQGS